MAGLSVLSSQKIAADISAGLSQWQQQGKWFGYADHSIFCRIEGQGEPLLLIHGFPTASWDWHEVWPVLTANYKVIALDLIGFGFSDKPLNYRYSILDQANLIEGFMREMGIGRYHILCHDYGVSVAQELLARQMSLDAVSKPIPEVASVAFLNGGLFPEEHQPALVQRLLASPLGSVVSRFITEGSFRWNMCHIFGAHTQPTVQQLHDLWYLVNYNNGRAVTHKLIRYMEERRCMRNRWVKALNAPVPLCFINGIADPISGARMADRYAQSVAKPYVVRIAGVGHYPQLEVPDEIVRSYHQFREKSALINAH
ncbi:MAG: alpha/beta hydrolase [Pseudomonadales bacterium]|nr:alpha/beta hydrolase [Pseudomonadales bacterium]